MVWGPNRQATYVFQRDGYKRSRCYGDCAARGRPSTPRASPSPAAARARSLLGTIRRRDGRLQVTYRGRPLYYYVNEGRGEVRCHNVDLNGGLWWVIGADGKRRP